MHGRRLTDSNLRYYIHGIETRRPLGAIAGRTIYGIQRSCLIPVRAIDDGHSTESTYMPSDREAKFLRLFQSIDLSKDFMFSYSYDLTHTLQSSMSRSKMDMALFDEQYTWNFVSAMRFIAAFPAGAHWLVPLVYGFFEQRSIDENNRSICATLLCRRSRHFAGTRYNRRGLSKSGRVANEVESEIMFCEGVKWTHARQKFSSHVLYRGSIPVFWGHDLKEKRRAQPKPAIVVEKTDPTFSTTVEHFSSLVERYGSPIVCLNLIRRVEKNPHESPLGEEYRFAVDRMMNGGPMEGIVKYVAYDFLFSQKAHANVTSDLIKLMRDHVAEIGFLFSQEFRNSAGPDSPLFMRKQQGIVRVNCIDCLDRTNFSQFCIAMCFLSWAATLFGWTSDVDIAMSEAYPGLVEELKKLFMAHGDRIVSYYVRIQSR
jgi:phosphatidylinositol 3,5-bisphosphate 5-phosphatase